MNRLVFSIALASAALAGCASSASRDRLQIQDATVLEDGFRVQQSVAAGAATRPWIDAHAGIAGSSLLDDVQNRLLLSGVRQSTYAGFKAQCWIDAAREERTYRNNWGFVEEATRQALMLTAALESGAPPPADNPALRTSAMVRPDLWERLIAAKRSPVFAECRPAQRRVACAEVELIHAGDEAWTCAFDASERRVAAIEPQIASVPALLDECAPPVAAVPPKVSLPTDMLFEFDRGDLDGMLPQGRERLDDLAARLAVDQDLTSVHVDGYTDRIGDDGYNMTLSAQRAATVVEYLRGHGVAVPLLPVGHGKGNPVVLCDERDRPALIACLAPNRRVDLTIERHVATTPDGPPQP